MKIIIDDTSSCDNVDFLGDCKISKYCSVYGSKEQKVVIGSNCYVGMFSLINGFNGIVTIGNNVSIAPRVTILTDSGPNSSLALQVKYPIEKGNISIGDNCWICSGAIILPGTEIGPNSVVGANSLVQGIFGDSEVLVGCPARSKNKK